MKKFILSIMMIAAMGASMAAPVFAKDAEEKCVLTSILGTSKCNENGEKIDENNPPDKIYNCSCEKTSATPKAEDTSIMHILNLVIDIMTVGVGILGVIGITIVGIQYLTAGGNEEKTRKAKRRLFEIIIGLVAYILIYAILKWLNVAPE